MRNHSLLITTFLLGCFLLLSCKREHPKMRVLSFDAIPLLRQLERPVTSISIEDAVDLPFDTVLSKIKQIRYIPLDDREPIGDIDRIVLTRDKIYILDMTVTSKIFVYDLTGELIFSIDKRGNGPGEYLSAWDIDIDTLRNEICINDPIGQYCRFYSSQTGDYIRKEKSIQNCYLQRVDSFTFNLVGYRQAFNDLEDYAVLVNYKDSMCYKAFPLFPLQQTNFIEKGFTRNYKNRLLVKPTYCDTIYEFASDSSYFAKFAVVQPKSIWEKRMEPLDDIQCSALIKENGYTALGTPTLETEHYLCFQLSKGYEGTYITSIPYFYNKDSGTVFTWKSSEKPEHAMRALLVPPATSYKNIFCGLANQYMIKQSVQALDIEIEDDSLQSYIDQASEDSNPMIVLYEFRDDF